MLQRDSLIRALKREAFFAPIALPLSAAAPATDAPKVRLQVLFLLSAEPEFILPKEYEEMQLLSQMAQALKLKASEWQCIRYRADRDPSVMAQLEILRPKVVVQFGRSGLFSTETEIQNFKAYDLKRAQNVAARFIRSYDLGKLMSEPALKKDFWNALKTAIY